VAAHAARDEGQTMNEEAWRVVCVDTTRAVHVVRYGGVWSASVGGEQYEGGDPRSAVMALVGRVGVRENWPVVEIVGPGEKTRAELRGVVLEYLDARVQVDKARTSQSIAGTIGAYAVDANRRTRAAYGRLFAASDALAAIVKGGA
jgi:hypothetical protein